MFPDSIQLDRSSGKPLHRQLCIAIRQAIRSGQLTGSAILPSSRKAAKELGISRNTVLTAYETLAAEGLIEGVSGSGTRVRVGLRAPILPAALDWKRVLREARFPARTVSFADPDGNPLYLSF